MNGVINEAAVPPGAAPLTAEEQVIVGENIAHKPGRSLSPNPFFEVPCHWGG